VPLDRGMSVGSIHRADASVPVGRRRKGTPPERKPRVASGKRVDAMGDPYAPLSAAAARVITAVGSVVLGYVVRGSAAWPRANHEADRRRPRPGSSA